MLYGTLPFWPCRINLTTTYIVRFLKIFVAVVMLLQFISSKRFWRTGQTRWGYSHRSFKPMVKRGLSTLACEDWNRWRVRKKEAVASSTGSKAETASHCGEQRAHWDIQGQWGHPLHPDLPPVVLTCLATGSGWPGRESEADDLCNYPSL